MPFLPPLAEVALGVEVAPGARRVRRAVVVVAARVRVLGRVVVVRVGIVTFSADGHRALVAEPELPRVAARRLAVVRLVKVLAGALGAEGGGEMAHTLDRITEINAIKFIIRLN